VRRLRITALVIVAVTATVAWPAFAGDSTFVPLGAWGVGHEVGPHVEGVAATSDGSIAVADRKRDRVVVFDREHEIAGSFPAHDPRGIAAVPGGGYLVSEPYRVRRVDAAGRTLATYPAKDPRGVALAGDTVLIADAWHGRILRYAEDGSPLAPWNAGLAAARGLAVGPDGGVFAADAGTGRIETFDSGGEHTGGWSVPHAYGVAVDGSGTISVVTDRAGTLTRFSSAGVALGSITPGLSRPRGVTVDCRGTVTVADNSSSRLSSYGDPAAPPPPCLDPPPPPAPRPAASAPPPPPAPPPAPEQPRLGRTAAVTPLSGTVFVGTGDKRRRLTARTILPVETEVDTSDGRVELVLETAPDDLDTFGAFQDGVFRGGAFTVHQGRNASLVELRLLDAAPAEESAARASRRRKRKRVWGTARGSFRTTGRHGAATVRGTRWLTEERPSGTFIKVTEGSVLAEAFERDQRKLLHAGQSFLARPACASRRHFRIRLRVPVGASVRSARVTVGGRRVKVRRGARITAPVDLRGEPRGVVKVRIRMVTRAGAVLKGTREYRTCSGPDAPRGVPEI
jgi:hypothetical protein